MRINPSALSQALFRFPHFLLLSGMLVTVSACSAFTEETIPMQAAEIEQLFAPEYAAIGAIVSVQLRINSGCAEFSHVEQTRTGRRVRFQAWSQDRDRTCGVVPNFRDIEERLQLDQIGLWEIEAGDEKALIDVRWVGIQSDRLLP